MKANSRVAIDVGGTFTDVVSLNAQDGKVKFDKLSTTPKDPQVAVMGGFELTGLGMENISHFIHGTTLGLNALLTRRGSKTAIVTTAGFRDVYLLGRTDRSPMYDWKYRKPSSLVERRNIFEIPERLNYEGKVLKEFDVAAAKKVAQVIKDQGIESVAVAFLHSYANPAHEQLMSKIINEVAPDVEVTCSSALSRAMREYERTSTAVLDAYIKPVVRKYITKLEQSLASNSFIGKFLMTRSGGGAMVASSAKESPVHLILSGPAGGVLGASWFAKETGHSNLITIDMGGTSLDASLIVDNEPLTHFEASFEGLPINVASLNIHTIGAGGGSLVWIDEGGHLQVGPASAGAFPGPAAYGLGGENATFTDAALQIGYLGSENALAGTLKLDSKLALAAFEKIAPKLKMDVNEIALGVIKISTTKIVGAVRAITVELGHKPSDFALLAFGGGGGLVALDVARELKIPTVIMPPGPGAFSAFGMLMADVQHDYSRSLISPLEGLDLANANAQMDSMLAEAKTELTGEGFEDSDQSFMFSLDLRYSGQEHSVTLPIANKLTSSLIQEIKESFEHSHEKLYGHSLPDPIEVVTIRLASKGLLERPVLNKSTASNSNSVKPISSRKVYTHDSKWVDYQIYHRDELQFGNQIPGPAIIHEHTATTVLHEKDVASIGAFGEIVIKVGEN